MDFPKIIEILPEGTKGIASLEHFEVSEDAANWSALRSAIIHGREDPVEAGKYVQLRVNGDLMMSDTQMEQNSNRKVLYRATGNVLIAGLGIGLILLPILSKPEVRSVTVIEKYQDVIDLTEEYLRMAAKTDHNKLRIVQADIFEWKPEKGTKFDTIYFDIWPNISGDNLKEMTQLHRRFSHYKALGCWMDSWMRSRIKQQYGR